ncbi:hypothetical protein HU200_015440 [Digitaria exilis]|uniref:Uncharacterized protein n=1 Tax=Digitaria exilis TaxID=1010633 RepID=A0A835KJP4_9POAL|nr:hypothetical protein HU200_015440 [Digitaria exilis]
MADRNATSEPPFSMEQFLADMEEAGGFFLVDTATGERFRKLHADVMDARARYDRLKALLDDTSAELDALREEYIAMAKHIAAVRLRTPPGNEGEYFSSPRRSRVFMEFRRQGVSGVSEGDQPTITGDKEGLPGSATTEPPFSMEQFLADMEEAGSFFVVDRATGERFRMLHAHVMHARARHNSFKALLDDTSAELDALRVEYIAMAKHIGAVRLRTPPGNLADMEEDGGRLRKLRHADDVMMDAEARYDRLKASLGDTTAELDALRMEYVAMAKHIAAVRLRTPPGNEGEGSGGRSTMDDEMELDVNPAPHAQVASADDQQLELAEVQRAFARIEARMAKTCGIYGEIVAAIDAVAAHVRQLRRLRAGAEGLGAEAELAEAVRNVVSVYGELSAGVRLVVAKRGSIVEMLRRNSMRLRGGGGAVEAADELADALQLIHIDLRD